MISIVLCWYTKTLIVLEYKELVFSIVIVFPFKMANVYNEGSVLVDLGKHKMYSY